MNPIIDQRALKEACKILGIKKEIRFRWQKNLIGMGKCSSSFDFHRITLKRGMSRADTNLTIWHELTHAAQWERYGPIICNKIYDIDMKRIGHAGRRRQTELYMSVPFEAEAYYTESLYGHKLIIK